MKAEWIEYLVSQVEDESKTLTEAKAGDTNKKQEYEAYLKSVGDLRGRPLYYPYLSSGLGNGALVQLLDGSVKIDFVCGIGPHILGHSHPELIKASLYGALEDTVMQGNLLMGKVYLKVLQKLIEVSSKNSKLAHAWFAPSGTMANENALKVIRQKKQGARKILAFERAFAGRSIMMCEITDNPVIKQGLPSYDEVLRVPFSPHDSSQALKVLKQHWETEKDNISCFIMELMQGDGGYFLAKRDFFVPLLEFCKSKGIAIWFDEVQTFGRSGNFFAFEKLNLGEYADVCTIGKALQMSASLWTKEYNPKPGLVSGTFSSSSSSMHSALAVLNILEDQIEKGHIDKVHKAWEERLQELEKESLISQIEGWGLMWGATPVTNQPKQVSQLLQILFEKGLICFSCGQGDIKRLRFLLPSVVTEQNLDQALSILRAGILELKKTTK